MHIIGAWKMEGKTTIKKCCDLKHGADKDAIMIVGVANAGLVGSIAANHIIEKLKMIEVAHVDSATFPPVSVFMDGILKHPFRIYADSKDKPAKVFLATTELPINRETFHDVAHVLVDYIEEMKIDSLVTLVGFPVNEMDDSKIDVFYAAEPELVERLKAIGNAIQPLPKGMIYGIEALILNEALERELDGFTLIVPVREYLPATRSAAALIDALNKIYAFLNIDTKDLLDQDKAIQSKLQELAEQIKRSQEPDQYIAPPPSKNTHSLFT